MPAANVFLQQYEHDDEDGEDDAPFRPADIRDCLLQAYHFERDCHVRGEPPYPQAELAKASDPNARRGIMKRYNSRQKRARAPENEQRDIKRRALEKRANKAAAEGSVKFFGAAKLGLHTSIKYFYFPHLGRHQVPISTPMLAGGGKFLRVPQEPRGETKRL